ncbi:protein rep [Flavobacterium luteolum]|uniref:protein rep n=1 Tax=Flavobacterium luteolum TaxID=3003259 RepID=UPI00248E6A4B|nr:protein rep [Flavobacterium luteolum]
MENGQTTPQNPLLENCLQRQFNTLGQNGTNKTGQKQAIVTGNGSDLNNNDGLKGRAKRKTITQAMILSLMDVAKLKGDTEKQNSYWNTYYCQSKIISAEGKFYGKYCKNRFCTLCCSIRKAEIINKYLPIIKEWQEPYFVTLTVKSCKANRLKVMIGKVLQGFSKIRAKHKKRHQRGNGIKLIGVKSLECNFNPTKQTYNPHLHLIVANEEIGELIVKEWLKIWTPKFTNRLGQDIRKVFDVETNLIEIIKYGSKIFTEPDMKKKNKYDNSYQIYISALDNILTAMKGKRIFERFGFNADKEAVPAHQEPKILTHFEEWEFNPKKSDWENVVTTEALANYEPKSQLIAILNSCIDLNSQ